MLEDEFQSSQDVVTASIMSALQGRDTSLLHPEVQVEYL
jgi:hypothetical protein